MRRELERIEIPGEHEARERTWNVVYAAFAERDPVAPSRMRMLRPAIAVALLVAALAAVVSPPGRAVLDELREAVGVERAQPALFSLPAPGRLLVASDAGVWVVQEDGSKRLLGPYREASWSPFGRFVVAASANELAALEPDGEVRWTLARPGVRSPRWTGTDTDTLIAYANRSGVRVVAGDGTGDRLLVPGARPPLAWRPGPEHHLSFVNRGGRVVIVDADTGQRVARVRIAATPKALSWSDDGTILLAVTPSGVRVANAQGHSVARGPSGDIVTAAFRPDALDAVAIRQVPGAATLFHWGDGGSLFHGRGGLSGLAWSPDGRWLLVGWPTADQWVFVRADGKRLRAVANVSEQFRSRSFPRVEGWQASAP